MDSIPFFKKLKKNNKDCDFSIVPLSALDEREREFFTSFMPAAKSAIVIMYYMRNLKDYVWNCPDGTIQSERCTIDDWSNEICLYIKSELEMRKISAAIVPYPGESGLQFRFVASASGCGEIGRNAFYLHPEYGPRVHLRVMATGLEHHTWTTINQKSKNVCLHCDNCIINCPASAFDNGFNGLQCRKYRKEAGQYTPVGSKGILRYCTKCIIVCKSGRK